MSSPPPEPGSPSSSDRPYAEPVSVGRRRPWLATTAALVFGIATPIVCLLMDPGVVIAKESEPATALAQGVESFGLTCLLLEMAILVLWLGLGRRLRSVSAGLAGGLFLGAGLAWMLAITVLPYSLFAITVGGMMAFIDPRSHWTFPAYGLLGLSVFLTGSVYFFQAKKVAELARERHSARGLLWRAVRGAALVIALALAAQVATELKHPIPPPPAPPQG